MGVSHLSPTGTQQSRQKIIDYRGNLVDIDPDIDRIVAEWRQEDVVRHFTQEYSFKEKEKWLGDHEKVLAETYHGAELRVLYHPNGLTQYYYIVIASKREFHKHNLALTHLDTYYQDLRKILEKTYGEIREKTSPWTSTTVKA